MPTISVLDATGFPVDVELPNEDGRQGASASRPVALSTEDLAAINALGTLIGTLTTAVNALLTDAQLRDTPVDIAGTVAATGTFTLSGALPAGTNNIGDVDVLTVPETATTTRALDYANGVTVTAGATTSASAAIAASEIYVHNAGEHRVYIRQGAATPTASVAATSLPIESGAGIWLRHTSGHLVAAIRDGAADCPVRIIPVA